MWDSVGQTPAALSRVRAPSPGRSSPWSGRPPLSLLVALQLCDRAAARCPRGAGRALPMSPLYFRLALRFPVPGGDTHMDTDVFLEKDNAVGMREGGNREWSIPGVRGTAGAGQEPRAPGGTGGPGEPGSGAAHAGTKGCKSPEGDKQREGVTGTVGMATPQKCRTGAESLLPPQREPVGPQRVPAPARGWWERGWGPRTVTGLPPSPFERMLGPAGNALGCVCICTGRA